MDKVTTTDRPQALVSGPRGSGTGGSGGAGGQRDVGAVVHAVRILRHLAQTPRPVGVAAVARETRISPSTCFNILRTLARTRFVAFREADKTYTLGMGLAELATGLVGLSHAELIRPELERLALNHDMLIVLWRVTEDAHIVLIDRAHSETAVRVEMQPGIRLPSLVGAVGRCVAAALRLPEQELRRRFAALRWQTPLSFAAYQTEVAQAARQGWAMDDGHLHRGMQTVAAIITDHAGVPRFGLSGITITGQHTREALERLGRELSEVARHVGASLFPQIGHPDPAPSGTAFPPRNAS
jgi:DNA-binding IclR family transcriptional regulator